jgi:hypothetical protein
MSSMSNTCIYLKFILDAIDKCDECISLTKELNEQEGDNTHGKLCIWHEYDITNFQKGHECTEYHTTKDIYTFDDLRGAIKAHENIWYYKYDQLEVSMSYILNIINYLEKDKKNE